MILETDGWYLVPGINLIMLRHNLLRLADDVRVGRPMTVDDMLKRIEDIMAYIPDDPPKAI